MKHREFGDLLVETGRDQAFLLPRNPESLYLFWEITSRGIERAEASFEHDLEWTLVGRLVEEPPGDTVIHKTFELESWLDEQLLECAESSAPLRAHIGLIDTRERFAEISRSAQIELPRRHSGSAPVRWVTRQRERDSYTYESDSVSDVSESNTDAPRIPSRSSESSRPTEELDEEESFGHMPGHTPDSSQSHLPDS